MQNQEDIIKDQSDQLEAEASGIELKETKKENKKSYKRRVKVA